MKVRNITTQTELRFDITSAYSFRKDAQLKFARYANVICEIESRWPSCPNTVLSLNLSKGKRTKFRIRKVYPWDFKNGLFSDYILVNEYYQQRGVLYVRHGWTHVQLIDRYGRHAYKFTIDGEIHEELKKILSSNKGDELQGAA